MSRHPALCTLRCVYFLYFSVTFLIAFALSSNNQKEFDLLFMGREWFIPSEKKSKKTKVKPFLGGACTSVDSNHESYNFWNLHWKAPGVPIAVLMMGGHFSRLLTLQQKSQNPDASWIVEISCLENPKNMKSKETVLFVDSLTHSDSKNEFI